MLPPCRCASFALSWHPGLASFVGQIISHFALGRAHALLPAVDCVLMVIHFSCVLGSAHSLSDNVSCLFVPLAVSLWLHRLPVVCVFSARPNCLACCRVCACLSSRYTCCPLPMVHLCTALSLAVGSRFLSCCLSLLGVSPWLWWSLCRYGASVVWPGLAPGAAYGPLALLLPGTARSGCSARRPAGLARGPVASSGPGPLRLPPFRPWPA